MKFIKNFENIGIKDLPLVGGKNASLGEMIQALPKKGILIPSGFAITAQAYKHHIQTNKLEKQIKQILAKMDKNKIKEFESFGEKIRNLIKNAPLPADLADEIKKAYRLLCKKYKKNCDVAVRSSATAEDLPEASFAGQQESFLNIQGEKELSEACLKAFASLFTNRAISYRIDHGFDHMKVALSVGVQKMVRSDKASAGVVFTLDTESGAKNVILINSSFGLGENVVQGTVNPDEFYVHKDTLEKGFKPILQKKLGNKLQKMIYTNSIKNPTKNIPTTELEQKSFSLSNNEILYLASQALLIEKYYSDLKGKWTPMDIEWAKDGVDGKIYIVQARPETIYSIKQNQPFTEEYVLEKAGKHTNKILVQGESIGRKIAYGKARVIKSAKFMNTLKNGEILITDMTDPDWEPIMKKAGGIITNRGGRTCHAAIISREIGIPAIIGTQNATAKIKTGTIITLDCSSGEIGKVYEGKIPFKIKKIEISKLPKLKTEIMVNVGNPDEAFGISKLPNDGVGLARLEFIINNSIQIHPMALIHPNKIEEKSVIKKIAELTFGYKDKKQFFIDKLAQEAGTIAAAFYPKPVIIRLSDFKSNEYRKLIGGQYFEPQEENPMIGWRGASRYYHKNYRQAFELECKAMKKIREEMGLTNVKIMLPFVRTIKEAQAVIAEMKKYGLSQGKNGLEIYMMCEIPSNVILIKEFSKIFDGFSIGSNDLTQMILAVDRDSEIISNIFDERNEAVKEMIAMAIKGAKECKIKIGICGQAPSDYPEFAKFLIKCGINSISLNPDTVLKEFLILG